MAVKAVVSLKWFAVAMVSVILAGPTIAQPEAPDIEITKPWTGDLEGMIERRTIRVLVPYSRTLYFLDGATQRGVVHEIMHEFENVLNRRLGRDKLKVNVIFLPTTRDQLLSALIDGRGDIAAANITVTPAREELVDFTLPLGRNVKELVVGHSGAAAPASLSDLSGRVVLLNRHSSYFEHLEVVNRRLTDDGEAPIEVRAAPDHFETSEILEMVNAGLVDYTVADSYIVRFWSQVFENLAVHEQVVLSDGNRIAFAIRPGSDDLKEALDDHLVDMRKGTLMGNILFNRYFRSTQFVTNARDGEERRRFLQMAPIFQRYAAGHGLDWLLTLAQGYQESRLDHSVVSPVGAVGVMQVLPETAKDMGIEDVDDLESNVLAGVRYVRYLIDHFFDDPEIDSSNRMMFALAAYNAGPNRIRRLRQLAAERGLDPNRWFNNVERVVAEKVGRETVRYVSNIYKYYVAYRLVHAESRAPDEGRPIGAEG